VWKSSSTDIFHFLIKIKKAYRAIFDCLHHWIPSNFFRFEIGFGYWLGQSILWLTKEFLEKLLVRLLKFPLESESTLKVLGQIRWLCYMKCPQRRWKHSDQYYNAVLGIYRGAFTIGSKLSLYSFPARTFWTSSTFTWFLEAIFINFIDKMMPLFSANLIAFLSLTSSKSNPTWDISSSSNTFLLFGDRWVFFFLTFLRHSCWNSFISLTTSHNLRRPSFQLPIIPSTPTGEPAFPPSHWFQSCDHQARPFCRSFSRKRSRVPFI